MKKISKIISFLSLTIVFLCLLNLSTKAQSWGNNYQEGKFYRVTSTGAIYWFFQTKLRYISSPDTYNGLFTDAPANTINVSAVSSTDIRGTLGPDNGLINDVNTGRVYLRRGSYIWYINSVETFNLYHFNWAAITNVNGIAAYTFCPAPTIDCDWNP